MSNGPRQARESTTRDLAIDLLREHLGSIQELLGEVRADTRQTREDVANIRERLARLEEHNAGRPLTPRKGRALAINIGTGAIGAAVTFVISHLAR